jgi:hypothetical protein
VEVCFAPSDDLRFLICSIGSHYGNSYACIWQNPTLFIMTPRQPKLLIRPRPFYGRMCTESSTAATHNEQPRANVKPQTVVEQVTTSSLRSLSVAMAFSQHLLMPTWAPTLSLTCSLWLLPQRYLTFDSDRPVGEGRCVRHSPKPAAVVEVGRGR